MQGVGALGFKRSAKASKNKFPFLLASLTVEPLLAMDSLLGVMYSVSFIISAFLLELIATDWLKDTFKAVKERFDS